MKLSRMLAWEVVLVHLLTGALFGALQIVLLANAGLEHWWVATLVFPVAVFSWLGWAYEGWIMWNGTADLRRNGEKDDD
jgi:hypothetical protein